MVNPYLTLVKNTCISIQNNQIIK